MSKTKLSKEEKKAVKAEKKAAKKEKRNPEVKKALIQAVAAILCVAIVSWGAGKVTDKVTTNKLELSQPTAESTDDPFGDLFSDDNGASGDAIVIDDNAAADDSTAADGASTGDSTSTDGTTGGSTGGTTGSTTGGSTGGTTAKKSLTTADLLNIFNEATKKAADKKVGFTKTRTTVEKKYEAGLALKSFKDIVYKFMGVGNDNKFSKTVTSADADSYFKYLLASSLTAADISNIAAKDTGNTYVIQIQLKEGSTAVSSGKVTANGKTALDKCGIACGENDKDYWDHKTAQNIFSAIDDVPGCGGASIKENYSDAVVTVEVTKDGNLKTFVAKFNFHVDIDGVMGSSGVAEAASTVTMTDFKW